MNVDSATWQALATLERLETALATGADLRPDDLYQLKAGLECFLRYDCPTLDAAFGLQSIGSRRRAKTLIKLAARDRNLRTAAAIFFPGIRPLPCARQLHAMLSRYRSTAWRRDCEAEFCPETYRGRLKALLWEILRADDSVISVRTIRQILAASGP